jgi:hypothetical protein
MFDFVTQHAFGAALLLAALLILASGCAARYTVHPGALNKTDSAAYDALLIAETAIDQAKLANRGEPKELLNRLIQTYNVARESWLTYRGVLTTSVPPQAYLDRLNQSLTDLMAAIRALEEATRSASALARSKSQ